MHCLLLLRFPVDEFICNLFYTMEPSLIPSNFFQQTAAEKTSRMQIIKTDKFVAYMTNLDPQMYIFYITLYFRLLLLL